MGTEEAQIRISVRDLVEFLLRSGDIDNRRGGAPDNAMLEGGRIHRMIQRRMGSEYQAEVTLRYERPAEGYTLLLEGRADGVIDTDQGILIDEIKSTYRELARMKEPVPVHLAQAKCYAYMYLSWKHPELAAAEAKEAGAVRLARKEAQPVREGVQPAWEDREEAQPARKAACPARGEPVRVRITYCHIETEEIRYFVQPCAPGELRDWFEALIEEYLKWSDLQQSWRKIRDASIRQLEFPYPYREGQRELAAYVYQTIYHKKKLFLEAPTGVGKTIAVLFPALKAMEKGMGERLFYLTAKTITRAVAESTLDLLRERGLRFKSVVLTAKEKLCFMERTECNPEYCPYARGHFDRINEAVYRMLAGEERFGRDEIERYALRHRVCPFELALDMSLFSDGIIGDYNYLFDPHVYLKRFFAEGLDGNYLFLIDEAHNLLERGREMYSAVLYKEDFLALKRELEKEPEGGIYKKSVLYREGYAARLEKGLEKCSRAMLALKRECRDCQVVEEIDALTGELLRCSGTVDSYLEEPEEAVLPVRESILELYFQMNHFLQIYEKLDERYVKYTQLAEDGRFLVKLFCVDPSANLRECMDKGRSAILFSATFLPIQYYKGLLGGQESDYEVYARSVFDPARRGLFIAEDVTSRYTRRSEQEFYRIARYISQIVGAKKGNYMVFCPSYAFLYRVYESYAEHFQGPGEECILQSDSMGEAQREDFLARFEGNEDCDLEAAIHMEIEMEEEQTLIGFCVLGGIFSEGIDLKEDSLIGAIIVGTGIPQVCSERELLKNYFDGRGSGGFDYSYRYPGMNKVLQAAGRVIRTAQDVGVVALLDDRFLQYAYQKMFPREWVSYEKVTEQNVGEKVEAFWRQWERGREEV